MREFSTKSETYYNHDNEKYKHQLYQVTFVKKEVTFERKLEM